MTFSQRTILASMGIGTGSPMGRSKSDITVTHKNARIIIAIYPNKDNPKFVKNNFLFLMIRNPSIKPFLDVCLAILDRATLKTSGFVINQIRAVFF